MIGWRGRILMSIEEIMQRMTLSEKIKLISGSESMKTHGVERLGIMPKKLSDGPHGVRIENGLCVAFPNLCLVGATWNKEVIRKLGEALAIECIEYDIDMLLGPGINIKKNILCGRNFEYISEDPVLSGELGASYIDGLQSFGVAASLKHFALNNQEKYRFVTSSEVDERTMREIYLKGFEIAVKKSNPVSVMCAYNKVNGIYCSENKYLLTDVLREEWGYEGFVVSDWESVHNKAKTIKAGLDLQMPPEEDCDQKVLDALNNGELNIYDIDNAVRRMLKFLLTDKPDKIRYDREKQHNIAAEIASEGIVLLKNDEQILPITKEKYKKIGIIGEFADKPLFTGQGSANMVPDKKFVDSPLEKIIERIPEIEVEYREFYKRGELPSDSPWGALWDLDEFIKNKDLLVVFMGAMDFEDTEFLDRTSAHLNKLYEMYLYELGRKTDKKIVLVLQNGGALLLADWKDKFGAIVEMWTAGEGAGTAIADILTGRKNPSGKLPETFPTKIRDDIEYPGDGLKVRYNEMWEVGYRYYDRHPDEVVYPFGHGLSYTNFAYSDLEVKSNNNIIKIKFLLKNTGDYDGSEVVQIYISDPETTISKPEKELKAFEKIFLKSKEEKHVEIEIPISELAYYNIMLKDWVIEDGEYKILVCASATDIRLVGSLQYFENKYTVNAAKRAVIG